MTMPFAEQKEKARKEKMEHELQQLYYLEHLQRRSKAEGREMSDEDVDLIEVLRGELGVRRSDREIKEPVRYADLVFGRKGEILEAVRLAFFTCLGRWVVLPLAS